ncbi:hypothetical protein LDJ79_22260 [Vibrio tritonius]|uniref:Type III secretion protein n=1 Tax=Vibrio tritonius TaxID=1435069 RepID=A0ABS7YU10_9VIBR|nr:hypothetical protein [Vibrio tritonius]MCA2018853.1 hypothetical protein [Vibrio tritonius]
MIKQQITQWLTTSQHTSGTRLPLSHDAVLQRQSRAGQDGVTLELNPLIYDELWLQSLLRQYHAHPEQFWCCKPFMSEKKTWCLWIELPSSGSVEQQVEQLLVMLTLAQLD